jgi:hypothetical protein
MATYHPPIPSHPTGRFNGFSLIELILAMGLGIALSGAIMQLLITDSEMGLRVNRLLRERSVQERTLALIHDDVLRASRISANPQLEKHACSLAGRLPVLHLSTSNGPITYSVGNAPSAIWRGQVLMRCGPAFALDGSWSVGSTSQNRVAVDGLAAKAVTWTGCNKLLAVEAGNAQPIDLASSSFHSFSACLDTQKNLFAARLLQELPSDSGRQLISSEALLTTRNQ